MLTEIALPCNVCKNPVAVKVSAQPAVLNLMACSSVVIEHPDQVTCPNCSTVLVVVVAGAPNILLMTARVPAQHQPNLVIPAGGPLHN